MKWVKKMQHNTNINIELDQPSCVICEQLGLTVHRLMWCRCVSETCFEWWNSGKLANKIRVNIGDFKQSIDFCNLVHSDCHAVFLRKSPTFSNNPETYGSTKPKAIDHSVRGAICNSIKVTEDRRHAKGTHWYRDVIDTLTGERGRTGRQEGQ